MCVCVCVCVCVGGLEGGEGALADIRNQCSHTHNVGHALLFTLLCHKLVTPPDNDVSLTGLMSVTYMYIHEHVHENTCV